MKDHIDKYIVKARGIFCPARKPHKVCYISVENGMIQAISDSMQGIVEREIIDFSDLMLSPCFCDYHLHFSGKAKDKAEAFGSTLLGHGISKAYEGGDKGLSGLSLKETLQENIRIKTSGYALYKKGGYGSAIGRGVADVAEAVVAINELHDLSVDYIKIIHSGVYEPESDMITAGGFEADELARIVAYARERGLEVYCHANGESAVREAVDAGVTAVIHGLYVNDSTLSAMATKKVSFIPTIYAFQSLLSLVKNDNARHCLEKTVQAHLSAVKRAYELKVRVLPGSDSGPRFIPYGSAYHGELRMFLLAGIPFEDLLLSAAAGQLNVGAPADFVLLDNISVVHVVIRGRFMPQQQTSSKIFSNLLK